MMRALWTAATGMWAQQFNLDVISNNLANVATTGYKRTRAEFAELLYQTLRIPGTPIATGAPVPLGIEVGHGTAIIGTKRDFAAGSLTQTNNPFDLAIAGDGFFQVLLPDGTIGYTRAGTFTRDPEGKFVLPEGYVLEPEIIIPEEATKITITEEGRVFVVLNDDYTTVTEVGRIELVKFINPAALRSIGKNIFQQTVASGEPISGEPATLGFGRIYQGWVESSNVNIVDEMVKLIVSQRAYEMNSRAIMTADAMLHTAAELKR